jgi:hypothetical protein
MIGDQVRLKNTVRTLGVILEEDVSREGARYKVIWGSPLESNTSWHTADEIRWLNSTDRGWTGP